ncbi:MAG TPA: SURF1 family protein [Chiayiivirga sp.]|nr:SURF1 family protein [Chiayiivirga sp.]
MRTSTVIWAMLALALSIGFAALGFWQSGRAQQKQAWLDAWAAALVAQAQPMEAALSQTPVSLPSRVTGRVQLRERPLLLLDGQQHEAQVGVRAYAVSEPLGDGRSLLVELGWSPFGPARALPTIEIPGGVQTLSGLLLPWPAQGLRLGENRWDEAPQTQLLAYLDRKEIERATGLRLYDGVLRPDPELDLGAQRDAVALPNTLPPAQHRGYAVQWWALSLTTVVAFLILFWRRRAK